MKKFKITKTMHNKVKSYLKNEYDMTGSYHENLSLYGFTNITSINNKIYIATLNPSGSGCDFVFYRFIDPVQYHHILKLERIREAMNDPKYKQKLFRDERVTRAMDWFGKLHTEVYKRRKELS